MPAGPPPVDVHLTYSQQYRRCGKPDCPSCAAGGPGHGPYWYAYWREGGRLRSRYLGKQAPAGRAPGESPDGTAAPSGARSGGHSALRVRTLGGFAAWQGDQPIPAATWRRRKVLALFTCLLSMPEHRVHREQVGEWLWPEARPAVATRNLHATLHLLRAVLDGPGAVSSTVRLDGDVLELQPRGGVAAVAWLDAAGFAHAASAALGGVDQAACRTALVLYSGDYLPDDLYDDWVVSRREELRQQHQALLLHLARLSGVAGDPDEAERCLRAALAGDSCQEDAAGPLMGLLAAQGRRTDALRVYQALATALELELGLAPDGEIEALRARLLAQEALPLAAAQPPRGDPVAAPGNLPASLTSFVGRSWEQREVARLLSATRLLTLTGPGGCGKTRLALEVARGQADASPDGVWLVELAALGDAALVPRAVAAALGVKEQAGYTAQDTLTTFLRPRHLLLALDNCEHVGGAGAALITALLSACPHLWVLATSREALGITGETLWRVPPLAVPPSGTPAAPETLLRYEAVRLFVERARSRQPAFTLTEDTAGAVMQVCRRLDGLPLALELAAARLAMLSVAAVAARLDDCFGLLTGGSRTALPRQQTLRATMEWSFGLLTEGEQRLLPRLAVFAGGCTLEAAEHVAGDAPRGAPAVVDLLGGLVAKSLVGLEDQGGLGRYRLLETVRHYAGERLQAAGETDTVRGRHLEWCLELAEQAASELQGAERKAWLQRLEDEHDNLRAALRWARQTQQIAPGLRLAGALWRFWWAHGYLSEGREWLETLLAAHVSPGGPAGDAGGGTPDSALRARALTAAAVLASEQGDYDRAVTLSERGAQIYRHLGDKVGVVSALGVLGTVAMRRADYPSATALYQECLDVRRDLGDRRGMAILLNNLAIVARHQDDSPRAADLFTESLTLKRALGDKHGIALALLNLGEVALDQCDYPRAAAVIEESLALLREQEDRWTIPLALNNLGDVARYQGDLERATALYTQSLTLYREMGNDADVGECLEGLAGVADAQGQAQRAARLLGATAALRATLRVPLPVADRAANERLVAATREALGDAAFGAAWAAGQALPLEQVIAEALT